MSEEAGRLWVVSTPIGNLEDVTLRALRVLREAGLVLAEDTRHTRKLLAHHGVSTPLRALHAHTDEAQVARYAAALAAGARVALVTDAGTPLVSDPGARLVEAAIDAGVPVEPVPGPSAVTAALVVAGIRCDAFHFVGFLPRGGGRRRRAVEELARARGAVVLFEAPTRLAATLRDLADHLGPDRRAAVCRELTKLHEEVARGTLAELAARFAEGARGEVTLVVEGTGDHAPPPADAEVDWRPRAAAWLAEGLSAKETAARLAAALAIPRREAYARVLSLSRADAER